MIIENLAKLTEWAAVQAAASGALDGLDRRTAAAAVESLGGAIWRHGIGQGLRPGDDWSWVLELYGPERIAEVVAAAGE